MLFVAISHQETEHTLTLFIVSRRNNVWLSQEEMTPSLISRKSAGDLKGSFPR
jgi:hypothetical protein